jgi:tyrosinase
VSTVTSAPSLFVRREVRSLGPDDPTLPAYAKAVAAMQAKPATDPTSWAYQAAIHGTHATNPDPGWNQCRHGTWYFVAWHRMYVYYFERIVRAAVIETGGPADWALPYWNYGLDGPNATLPPAFRDPTVNGQPNPLYVAQRAPGINGGATIPPAVTSSTSALSRSLFVGATEFGGGITSAGGQFWSQTGRLEQTPHNDMHNAVGGQDGWMADPDQAAQDPIFWLHHTNIDRLWAVWSGAGHAAAQDARWAQESFSFFDAGGGSASKRCADVLDTVTDLGYTYDPSPVPSHPQDLIAASTVNEPPPPEPEMVAATEQPVQLVGNEQRLSMVVDRRAQDSAVRALAAREPRIFLNVEDIEAPKNPGTVYGIYVNLPEGAPVDQEPLHHVGNLSFFGIERARQPRGDEHSHGLRVTADITDVVRALQARGQWDGAHVDVTFRPLELIPPDGLGATDLAGPAGVRQDPPVTVGRVSVFYG